MIYCAKSINVGDDMEQTLAIIKPDAIKKKQVGEIIKRIEASGISIAAMKWTRMSVEKVEELYSVHKEKHFFPLLLDFTTSGPCVVMVLRGSDVIGRWRKLMGATNPKKAEQGTIRRDLAFGAEKLEENLVHGSDSPESARREIACFFNEEEMT